MPAIPPNSLIVVTGVTGYIGSHVGLAALQAGHRVRGTVRSFALAEELKAGYAKYGADVSKLELVKLDDLTSDAQLEAAFADADGVAHVAVPGGVPGSDDESPQWAVQSSNAVLRAARKVGTVKRVVFTSSSVASIMPPLVAHPDRVVTDKDWNDAGLETWKTATEETKNSPMWVRLRYAATKVLSEKAAWEWVEQEKPDFDIVTILPNANFGPSLCGGPRTTGAWIHQVMQNDDTLVKNVPPQWFVDVRDNGRLHVLALATPSLGGRRIWAVAEPSEWNKILAIIRKAFPHVQVPDDVSGQQGEPDQQRIDNSVATEALGGWIGLEQSVIDTARSFGF
ncbi:NAD(P)-binding protein [Wolfiporia cocos MD-104 SS10]|uniref:NAD(P)-binding protein n=1 Tax=Wolfiporia cocos (strain MD-104) TaxID=742152 RepID=A0A2H3JEL5_WOLCO|nr:NAD(P)-binding protein [Wolfiporia cocos MD-104 SS10]